MAMSVRDGTISVMHPTLVGVASPSVIGAVAARQIPSLREGAGAGPMAIRGSLHYNCLRQQNITMLNPRQHRHHSFTSIVFDLNLKSGLLQGITFAGQKGQHPSLPFAACPDSQEGKVWQPRVWNATFQR